MREQMTLTLTPIPMHRVSIKYCVVAGVPADARARVFLASLPLLRRY